MHRQFITYQGRPLVVGEEDDLLTIPEPGIEVNEILGSAEVTEKIAEDVQVGDFLYKSTRYVDNFDGPPVYFPTKTSITSFDGEMYIIVESITSAQVYIYKNVNGRWVDQLARNSYDWSLGYNYRGLLGAFASSKYIYGLYSSQDNRGTGYKLNRLENGVWTEIRPNFTDLHIDASGAVAVDTGYNIKPMMFEGKIHLPLLNQSNASSIFTPYIYNEDTNTIEKVECDLSSIIPGLGGVGHSELVVHEGDLYSIHGTDNRLFCYKYDTSANRWNYVVEVNSGLSHGGKAGYPFSTSAGIFVALNNDQSNYACGNLYRIDTDSSAVYSYAVPSDPTLNIIKSNSVGLWQEGDYLYMFGSGQGAYASRTGGNFTVKLELSTSSFTFLSGVMDWKTNAKANTGDLYHQGDFFEHEGEKYAVIHKGSAQTPHALIFKWNTSTQRWDDVSYWGVLADSGVRTASPTDVYEYSGVHYVAKESYNNYLVFGKFVTSGDPSGYFDNISGYDVGYNYRPANCKFYETSGQLYCFVTYNNSTNPASIYQLTDHNVGYFNKLDQSVVSAIGNVAVYPGPQPAMVELSGVYYVALQHTSFTSNPIVTTYTLEGSSLTKITDLSAVGATEALSFGYMSPKLVVHDNQVFMFFSTFSNAQPSFLCWKLNGSTWEDVAVSSNFNSRAQSCPFVLSGNLYNLVLDDEGEDRARLYKYDGSSFDIDYTEDPPHPHDTFQASLPIVVNDDVYIFTDGYQGGGPASNGIVRRSNGTWYIFACHPGAGITNVPVTSFRVNDEVFSIITLYSGKNGGVLSKVKTEFFGEDVWYKNDLPSSLYNGKSTATGIALESGSKGDTIRIQKVRR